ncbi:cytidylyltransferase domain-containing protein [Paenibacillus harenae]|uniref:acylneuraminate cytidylyltransferase family protein n=1 Tax=Paenibacillus harenae TaxID=306543 RepID=UPI0004275E12|nr:acylneuraminate cytidylyltransferase family protein [Paenibacillus harenae]
MKDSRELLAIIPARAGSKGIPGKNIRPLGGKPLIAWTIEAARQSSLIGRVVLTTDCEEISEIGRMYGAETPFLRPKHLSEDTTPMADVIFHVLESLKEQSGELPGSFILLQPTTPLRTVKHINEAITLFDKQDCDAVVSVCEVMEHPYLMKTIKDNELHDLIADSGRHTRRQDYPTVYKLNGCIYVYDTEMYLARKELHMRKYVPYIMEAKDSIDIDTPFDFEMAKAYLKARERG